MVSQNSDNESGSSSETESSAGSSSRQRSHTPSQHDKSPSGSERSHSGTPAGSGRSSSNSRSRTPHSKRSGSIVSNYSEADEQGSHVHSKSGTPQSHRSVSVTSGHSHRSLKSKSPKHNEQLPEDSRSNSPNLQIDDRSHSKSRSRSRSYSHSHSVSRSRSRSRSLSGTRSNTGSPRALRSRSNSVQSRSRSLTRSRSRSKVRSPSLTRSRSATPKLRSGSESDGDKDVDEIGKGKSKRKASDSENNENKNQTSENKIKKPRIVDTDSESEEQKATKVIDAQDIFGDADDISLSEDEDMKTKDGNILESGSRKSRSKSRSRSSSRASERSRSHSRSKSLSRSRSRSLSQEQGAEEVQQEKDEAEPEPEVIPETRIDVEIPRIVTDLGREIHFVKLPNFLSVETRPFDAETYEDEIDEEETMDEEGRQRIKLKVSNTIRWREYMNNKGDVIKESNARFVRWSDGSMSLHLGNEIFDVYRQPLHGDHNHMFIRQGTGLQGQAVFRTKLTFRPHSTESFTHKKMTMSLADRSQKVSGIKILTQVGKDPTADRLYNLKKEEEKLRQAMRSQYKSQPKKKKNLNDSHGSAGHTSYNQDEGSDDENAISLSAIKNRYKKGANTLATSTGSNADNKASAIYSSDDDDGSDFEGRRSKKAADKTRVVKALRDSDSESDIEQGTKKAGSNAGDNSENDDANKSTHGSGSEEDWDKS